MSCLQARRFPAGQAGGCGVEPSSIGRPKPCRRGTSPYVLRVLVGPTSAATNDRIQSLPIPHVPVLLVR
jgi:hypothetical protein